MTTPAPTPEPQKWTIDDCNLRHDGITVAYIYGHTEHEHDILAALNANGDADTRRLREAFAMAMRVLEATHDNPDYDQCSQCQALEQIQKIIGVERPATETTISNASERGSGDGSSPSAGPIPAPAATSCAAPADWQDLERGKDTTQAGDEMSASNGPWVRAAVGLTNWPPSVRIRRRVDEWRMLKHKEPILAGDEYNSSIDGKWHPSPWVGRNHDEKFMRAHRRRREPVNAPRTAAFANAALRAKYESTPVEAEGQTPRVSYAEQAHELVDKLATAMRTREPFTPLILTFAEDIAAPLRAEIARAEQALAEERDEVELKQACIVGMGQTQDRLAEWREAFKAWIPQSGDRSPKDIYHSLESRWNNTVKELADAQRERDDWKRQYDTQTQYAIEFQSERERLRADLERVTRERDEAVIQRTRQEQIDRDKIIGLESQVAVAVEALRKCAFPNYCGGERSDMLSVVIERQEIARAAYETARQAGLEGKER